VIRSHGAGAVSEADIGSEVVIAGWVQRRRDHGGVSFIDVRDATGLVQVVADPVEHPTVADLKMEYCVRVRGDRGPGALQDFAVHDRRPHRRR